MPGASQMPTVIIGSTAILFGLAVVWLRTRSSLRLVDRHLAGRIPMDADVFAAAYDPPEHAGVAVRLRAILAEVTVVDVDLLRPDDEFAKDLHIDELDSMALAEFVVDVEKEFSIAVPELEWESLRTFRDVVSAVAMRVPGAMDATSTLTPKGRAETTPWL
jgi:acyl carrier protein